MRPLTLLLLAAVLTPATIAIAQPTERPLAMRATDPTLRWGPCPPLFPGACEITVLHGDPAKPNSDVLLRVGPGYRLPPHSHSSAERMMLVEGQLQVRYQGSPRRVLTPGMYAYGPARLPHEARCISAKRCTLFIAFEGLVDAMPVSGPLR